MEFVSYTRWDQLPESANALFAKYEKASIFFSRQWFENMQATALNDDESMLLACVINDNCVLAILPLMTGKNKSWHAFSTYYTSLYTLLIADDDRSKILACLVRGLSQSTFQSFRLFPVADDDENMDSLQQLMESSGFECYRNFRFYNWRHQLQGQSFEAYMSARPARVRNTIARKKRKLEREHGYDIRLIKGCDLQQAMADYNAIYRASWKANEIFGEFIQGMVERLAEPGWLRLAILYIAGKPAAGQIWFVAHGKASIFRLAYDQAWKCYSPGSILTEYLMAYVIDVDAVEEIDFLTGNDRYKQEWMSERRERWLLGCLNKREPEKVSLFIRMITGLQTCFRNFRKY